MTNRATAPSSECKPVPVESFRAPGFGTLEPEIRTVVLTAMERAQKDFRSIEPDVVVTEKLRMSQRARLRLKAARENDGTPRLLRTSDGSVEWDKVLIALESHLRWTTFRENARIVVAVDPEVAPLETVLDEVGEEVERLRTAINRNGTEKLKAEALRSHVFADRRTPRSRPSALTEVEDIRAALVELPPDAPQWLKEFDERLARVQNRLELAYDGRNRPKTVKVWSAEVLLAVLALDIVLGDLLGWAGLTATLPRLKQFKRVITPPKPRTTTRNLAEASESTEENEEIEENEDLTDEERELDAELEPVEIGGGKEEDETP